VASPEARSSFEDAGRLRSEAPGRRTPNKSDVRPLSSSRTAVTMLPERVEVDGMSVTASGSGKGAASTLEKGGGSFRGIKLLLCENPLPPLDEAIVAARDVLPESNYYTEPFSGPLRALISERLQVPERLIHVNAGSELILRQLFDRFGERVLLLTPTYPLFPEIARQRFEIDLRPEDGFGFDFGRLTIPGGTSLVVFVNPNNPTGTVFDVDPLLRLLSTHPETRFLVDEAFIDFGGRSVVDLVPHHDNLLVTRTLSKAHSLAGFRIGYAVVPRDVADDLNAHNDAYPLTRPGQAAAVATLEHEEAIRARVRELRGWARKLADDLRRLGVRTFPTETYFFLADFAPWDASEVARDLRDYGILIKPLDDPRLGPGYLRVTTALPQDNARFVAVVAELMERRSSFPGTAG
jgi:histidinol-phosphate aminotransferase